MTPAAYFAYRSKPSGLNHSALNMAIGAVDDCSKGRPRCSLCLCERLADLLGDPVVLVLDQ